MDHFAGLDVSVKETSVCIVDDTGKIVREVKVASEPEDLLRVLANPIYHFKRIGLEAGPLSQWLFSALAGQSRHRNILVANGGRLLRSTGLCPTGTLSLASWLCLHGHH
jgi:predicted NBD/HSP70 family sugar kinase